MLNKKGDTTIVTINGRKINKKNKARDKFRDIKEKQTDTTTITYFSMNLKE